MKINSFLLFPVLLVSISVTAQPESTQSRVAYFVSLHSGGLLGEKGVGSTLTTCLIQGVRYKRFAMGAGVGYDAYTEWHTLPVFGLFGYDIARRGIHAFFIQVSAGYASASNPLSDQDQFVYGHEGGNYLYPALGYRITEGKMSVYLTAGYKFQRLHYEQIPRWWNRGGYPYNKTTVQRDMQRISVTLGVGFR